MTKMLPLTKEEKKYCKQDFCHTCKKEFSDYNDADKNLTLMWLGYLNNLTRTPLHPIPSLYFKKN